MLTFTTQTFDAVCSERFFTLVSKALCPNWRVESKPADCPAGDLELISLKLLIQK